MPNFTQFDSILQYELLTSNRAFLVKKHCPKDYYFMFAFFGFQVFSQQSISTVIINFNVEKTE